MSARASRRAKDREWLARHLVCPKGDMDVITMAVPNTTYFGAFFFTSVVLSFVRITNRRRTAIKALAVTMCEQTFNHDVRSYEKTMHCRHQGGLPPVCIGGKLQAQRARTSMSRRFAAGEAPTLAIEGLHRPLFFSPRLFSSAVIQPKSSRVLHKPRLPQLPSCS